MTKFSPKVSVVMAVYDEAEYISTAIEDSGESPGGV